MANRILIGNRSTGGYGLYVSKTGEDVLTTTETLAFDSRTGTGWTVKKIQESSIAWNGADQDIAHNLGYEPLVAIRWSHAITSGYSTAVYNPCWMEHWQEDPGQGGGQVEYTARGGLRWYHKNNNTVTVQNQANTNAQQTIYYACIIFNEPDFTGGRGL